MFLATDTKNNANRRRHGKAIPVGEDVTDDRNESGDKVNGSVPKNSILHYPNSKEGNGNDVHRSEGHPYSPSSRQNKSLITPKT